MNYGDIPVIILLLAAGYLLAIYVFLSLARHLKLTRNSFRDLGSTSNLP